MTSRAKVVDVTRDIVVLLRELWDVVVFPIVKILQQACPYRSRVWWCPTAEFSPLSLHATGSYRKGQPKFSDLYISSYTLILTVLIRMRQKLPSVPAGFALGDGLFEVEDIMPYDLRNAKLAYLSAYHATVRDEMRWSILLPRCSFPGSG